MFDDEMLTIDEIASFLKLKPQTIYKWAQSGKIPGAKFGKEWRFRRSAIERWIDDQIDDQVDEPIDDSIDDPLDDPNRQRGSSKSRPESSRARASQLHGGDGASRPESARPGAAGDGVGNLDAGIGNAALGNDGIGGSPIDRTMSRNGSSKEPARRNQADGAGQQAVRSNGKATSAPRRRTSSERELGSKSSDGPSSERVKKAGPATN